MKSLFVLILFTPFAVALANKDSKQPSSPSFKFNKDQVEQVQNLMNIVKAKCGKDHLCELNQFAEYTKKAIENLKGECSKGNKEACTQHELYIEKSKMFEAK
jgi:hypothetical protein